ncbi:MAG: non-heme iron oxygenase ferredoxin subunit [Nitrospirae bacterium]|nr:MAG: non-heme iron oxygenase ferredoxin subunit [Nitrospirota bacterium]
MEKQFRSVAQLSDLPPGTCLSIELPEAGIALFNVKGEVFALDNTCPHAGGPLGEGCLTGDLVACPWHGWKFNVRTGACLKNPSPSWQVTRYETRVVNGEVQVLLPISQSSSTTKSLGNEGVGAAHETA